MIIRNGKFTLCKPNQQIYSNDGSLNWNYSSSKEMPAQIVPLEQDAHRRTSATGRPIDYAKYMILVEARDYEAFINKYNRPNEGFIAPDMGVNVFVQIVSVEHLRAVSQYKLIAIQRTHG